MNTKLRIIFLLMFTVSCLFAESDETVNFVTDVSGSGTSAASFLEIGAGARAMGMGGAFASVANDVSALYWNPAGIAWVNQFQVEVMHNEWLVDTSYDFVGLVVPLPMLHSSFGFSLISLGYGKEQVRTVEMPEGTGETFDGRDFAFGLSWATALTDRFSFGFTGKYVRQRIWTMSGSAAAVDVGIFYNTMISGLRLGAAMTNFGTKLSYGGRHLMTIVDPDEGIENYDRVPVNYDTDSYNLPLLFRIGLSYERNLASLGNLLLSVDAYHPSNAKEGINIGAEWGFNNMFYLRGGYENMFEKDHINGVTFGGGIDLYRRGQTGIRIDYAWSDWDVLDSAQRFSVGLIF